MTSNVHFPVVWIAIVIVDSVDKIYGLFCKKRFVDFYLKL